MEIMVKVLWNLVPTLCLYVAWKIESYVVLVIMAVMLITILQAAAIDREKIARAQYKLIETQNKLIDAQRDLIPNPPPRAEGE